MMEEKYPRIAVLVDLPRDAAAGGHVKYWERVAEACAKDEAPVDLTVYFLGAGGKEILSPRVRYKYLPPIFSTERLKFLPYVPAHTDLASRHPILARQLKAYDILHTTGGFFSFARTAERVSREKKIPLVTSFHTDTPSYAELFTHETLLKWLGKNLGGWIDGLFKISNKERQKKEKRLAAHVSVCRAAWAVRAEDRALARKYIPEEDIKPMRMGVDKELFSPNAAARAEIGQEYGVGPEDFLALFVGRVDVGKNMPLLARACARAREKGARLHLFAVGLGPAQEEAKKILGEAVTLAGFLPPEKLAKAYAASDVLCMASDVEIGGLVAAEAMACGCPVLASALNGVASYYGRPASIKEVASDTEAWAQELQAMACDKARQAAMRDAALAFRRDRLASWSEVLKEDFLPIWESLARKEKR